MLGISFGVVIGKEIFGGVGMNVLNPALAGADRARRKTAKRHESQAATRDLPSKPLPPSSGSGLQALGNTLIPRLSSSKSRFNFHVSRDLECPTEPYLALQ